MKRLVFRFDIDTHKCIREGHQDYWIFPDSIMYHLLFLNAGKAVSIADSLKRLHSKRRVPIEHYEMMSAMQKLGKIDYLKAALINPKISDYKSQIRQLLTSDCEVGLHGGRNHSLWGR